MHIKNHNYMYILTHGIKICLCECLHMYITLARTHARTNTHTHTHTHTHTQEDGFVAKILRESGSNDVPVGEIVLVICSRMLTYADVCCRTLMTYADVR